MQLIKPLHLGLVQQVLFIDGQYQLCIAPLMWFSLLDQGKMVDEQTAWKKMQLGLSEGDIPDPGFPKNYGEVLISGAAYGPPGEEAISVEAGVTFDNGAIEKDLCICGDQYWVTRGGRWTLSDMESVNGVRLSWLNAFGGESFADNPFGKGVCDKEGKGMTDKGIPLPNVRSSLNEIKRPNGAYYPVGFGPMDFRMPVRQKRAGTYDESWLKSGYPGLAPDHDPAIYNAAPEDQWIGGYFEGTESFELRGMHPEHPVIKGQLPGMRARGFIRREGADPKKLESIDTRIDTVWFFPDQEIGLIISRGMTAVDDSDGLDVASLMIAYERLDDAPRPLAHYERVYGLRTDPETAVAHMMNESQLSPEKTELELQQMEEEKKNAQKEWEELVDKNVEQTLKEINKAAKEMDEEADEVAKPEVKPSPLPIIPKEAIERKDVDLTELIEASEKVIKEAEEEGKKQMEAFEKEMEDEMMKDALQETENKKKTLDEVADEIEKRFQPVEAVEMDEEILLTEDQLKEMREVQNMARRSAPNDTTEAAQFDDDVRQFLRKRVNELLSQQQPICGLDLSGADLSGMDFSGLELSGTMFESADLSNCNFSQSNLSQAVFTEAKLDNACFDNCNLMESNFSGVTVKGISLRNSDFANCNMIRTHFERCDFSHSRFNAVVFVESTLDGCQFNQCQFDAFQCAKTSAKATQFKEASLSRCIFADIDMENSDFSSSSMARCMFLQIRGESCNFSKCQLDRVQFGGDTSFSKSDFREICAVTIGFQKTDLSFSRYTDAAVKKANFAEADLSGANMDRAGFLGSNFGKAIMKDVSAVDANFTECLIRKSHWQDSDASGAEFFNAVGEQTVFVDCNLDGVRNFPKMAEVHYDR